MSSILEYIFGHKWQNRGQNGYGTYTYRVCLRCGKAQKLISKIGEKNKWGECDRLPELDSQFDENNKFIFHK